MGKLPGHHGDIINLYLVSLQKTFYYSKENSFILKEIQIVYDMEACKVVKGGFCMVKSERNTTKDATYILMHWILSYLSFLNENMLV